MKVLVIPDVHLKPWMFDRATEIMKSGVAEKAVCLMDIPDDWGQEYNLGLYEDTFDAAIRFQKAYPDVLKNSYAKFLPDMHRLLFPEKKNNSSFC